MGYYEDDEILKRVYKDVPINEFKGSVLYVGMGSAWVPRIQPKAVKRTVIVEIDQDIIDRYFHKLNPDWEIIRFDAWKFHTEDRFDFIFIDIWDSIILDKYMKIIENKYSNFLNPEGKVVFLESIRVF